MARHFFFRMPKERCWKLEASHGGGSVCACENICGTLTVSMWRNGGINQGLHWMISSGRGARFSAVL